MNNSLSDEITKYKIYCRTSPDTGSTIGYSFVDTVNKTLSPKPPKDFYINLCLTKSISLDYYVSVDKDPTVYTMQRDEFNPYFLEFGFFKGIARNEINSGNDLTSLQINYLRSTISAISSFTDTEIITWYNNIGRYSSLVNVKTLERLSLNNADIVSKAYFFNIDINS